jgi:hypothetical protein
MTRSIPVIQDELKSLQNRLKTLSESGGKVIAALSAVAAAEDDDYEAGLNESTGQFSELLKQPEAVAIAGWDEAFWETYEGTLCDEPMDRIRLGGLIEPANPGASADCDLPFMLPLLAADGPIILVHDEATSQTARAAMQAYLLRAALAMPGSIRFTLIDPAGMGAAYPFGGFLGRTMRAGGRSPGDDLMDVQADIRRINERVIGEASRFSALSSKQRAGETFELVAAADFPKAYFKDPRALEGLIRVGTAGPRTGRHLIIEWNADEKLPHDFSSDAFGPNAIIVDCRDEPFRADSLPDTARQKALLELAQESNRHKGAGDWHAIVQPAELQTETAQDRVQTPVGERLRFWLGEDENGKPSAHAMIAGQTGSGKSSALHVIITGLAARYSPDELQMTLIDGKQGVEFEAYRTLAHADVVCLRTTPALARSVVADFLAEMDARFEAFQTVGAVKLSDYRIKTGETMPRRILFVDEYQQLLDGDPERGADMLSRLLEKGRAAGMHIVLGSQTFERSGLPSSAMTHVHTWISLSLSGSYVQGLQVFGPEGKRLIKELATTGEVVINDEGGRDGANSRGAVARLEDAAKKPLLPGIVEMITATGGKPGNAIVLSGREGAQVSDNPFCMLWRGNPPAPDMLQTIARKSPRAGGLGIETWLAAEQPIPLWLGRRFDVRGHALCPIRRAPGNNILVLGSQIEVRNRMLASGLAALSTMITPDRLSLLHINGLRDDMPGGGMIGIAFDHLASCGFDVQEVGPVQGAGYLARLAAAVTSGQAQDKSTLVIISEPEYHYDLQGGTDFFNAPQEGPIADLRKILSRGSPMGVHVLLTASGLASFGLILSAGREVSHFNHRIVQQMNEEDSMSLFSSLAAARVHEQADHPFAALYVDQMQGPRAAALFHSYCASRAIADNQGLDALADEVGKLKA